jgi:FlaA1/EpsC-like NDP-sugar epimerase
MAAYITDTIKSHLSFIRSLGSNPKFWYIFVLDMVLILLAHLLAYNIRFEDGPHGAQFNQFLKILPLLFLIKIPVFYIFGLYRGMWRYTGMIDLINISKATLMSAIILISVLLYSTRFIGFSRSVFILDTLFTFLLICGHRVAIRFFYQKTSGSRMLATAEQGLRKKRLLLIGAGDSAERIIRELHDNKTLPYAVVGLLDDNPAKVSMKIHGVPVLGIIDDLKEHSQLIHAEELLITVSSASGKKMKRLISLCQDTGIPFKALPGLGELIDGKVSLKNMRDISYKDLLGRKEVHLDQVKIGSYLTGKTVLVTGAGGSIGSELCRQILRFSPQRIILFDAGEENLYSIQMELHHEFMFTDYVPVLAKVQNLALLETVFTEYKPAVVFHAAAYKHVPLIEVNPWEAVFNNILATRRIIETSIVHGVERFVLVSTDKAVRPTNVMGASKRMTELIMLSHCRENWDGSFCPYRSICLEEADLKPDKQEAAAHDTIFMAVRFGNVLGSSGSVIPLFKQQIERGGPVTVTHPDITRYFMSLEEAAQLILQAGGMGEGGEIFILKMGEPIVIADMARSLIKLAGREPDTEIEIKFTGLREGEKLYEELITEGEGIVETGHEKIMVLRGESTCCHDLQEGLNLLMKNATRHNGQGIKAALQQLVPEYKPDTDSRSIRQGKR